MSEGTELGILLMLIGAWFIAVWIQWRKDKEDE